MTLRIFAPAKVNLHLAVGAPGPDGYHPVETVLQALAFGDTVTIEHGEPLFRCMPDLGLAASDNLAWRAAQAMADAFGHALDAAIAVEKRVPAGAGLGGASADAAAVIIGLAELWALEVSTPRLVEVARTLGADVAFFLEGGAALYTGRGDVLARRLPPLDAAVALVKPAEPVATAAAYAAFDDHGVPSPVSPRALIEALESRDVRAAASCLHNAMTASSAGLVPAIADALALVRGCSGVLGAAMAGSGSAVFGVCEDSASADACVELAVSRGLWAVATRTYAGGCLVERA